MAVLVAGQILGGVGISFGVAVSGLLAEELSGLPALAGVAQTASILGAALVAVPLSRVMAARGRRPGLSMGYLLAAAGAGLSVVSAAVHQVVLLLVALCLFGAGTAANLLSRYAATDLASPVRRGRALSVVVWATTVGVVIGPNLAGPAGRTGAALGLSELAGPFIWSAVAFCVAAVVLLGLLRPDPLLLARERLGKDAVKASRPTLRASLGAIRGSTLALFGMSASAVANAVMVGVMGMAPIHLSHGGVSLEVIGLVISVHIAGMYALSPVFGWLVDRLGRVSVVLIGQVLLLAALVVCGTAPPHAGAQLGVGLFLLGLGWSCGLVAGSTLLTESVSATIRPGVQGAGDLIIGLAGAVGGTLAGLVFASSSYGILAALAAVLVVPVVAAALHPSVRLATGQVRKTG
jgi:MFS family permease